MFGSVVIVASLEEGFVFGLFVSQVLDGFALQVGGGGIVGGIGVVGEPGVIVGYFGAVDGEGDVHSVGGFAKVVEGLDDGGGGLVEIGGGGVGVGGGGVAEEVNGGDGVRAVEEEAYEEGARDGGADGGLCSIHHDCSRYCIQYSVQYCISLSRLLLYCTIL